MSLYKPLKIETMEVAGLMTSLIAMRAPIEGSENDSVFIEESDWWWEMPEDGKRFFGPECSVSLGEDDARLAGKLIRGGDEHAKALRGPEVWFKIEMQVGFMIEWDTYRIGIECLSSSSAMHGELKGISGVELAEKKQEGLPEKVYTRYFKATYQTLGRMYRQRNGHRHPDWKIFREWVESLPYFKELILAEKK